MPQSTETTRDRAWTTFVDLVSSNLEEVLSTMNVAGNSSINFTPFGLGEGDVHSSLSPPRVWRYGLESVINFINNLCFIRCVLFVIQRSLYIFSSFPVLYSYYLDSGSIASNISPCQYNDYV